MYRIVSAMMLVWLAMLSAGAHAFVPESGWWWNQDQSGRGFAIEIQDDSLFMATFIYGSDGRPVWYIAGGPMSSERRFDGPLLRMKDGQCIGCSYRPPTPDGNVGPITINFETEMTGTITWGSGEVVPISRFPFGLDTRAPHLLLGEWAVIQGAPVLPIYFGDRLSLLTTVTSEGRLFAAGNRTGAPARLAVGFQEGAAWYLLLDSSTSYYTLYVFRFAGLNQVQGSAWTYLKSGSPSGAGLPFLGHRIQGASAVVSEASLGVASLAGVQSAESRTERVEPLGVVEDDARDRQRASLHQTTEWAAGDDVADDEVKEMARQLQLDLSNLPEL